MILRGLLLAALLGAVVVLLVSLVPGSGKRLENAPAGWLVAGVALEVVACAGYAWLFHAVFSYGAYRSSPWRSTQIAVGELGLFAVVPTGIGGPVLRVWALMRGGMPLRDVAVRSVAHAPIFNVPYVSAAVLLGIGVTAGVGIGHAPVDVALAPLGVVFVSVAVAVAATLYVRTRRSEPQARWRQLARAGIRTVPDGLREVPGRLRVPGSLLGAVGYWAGDCAVLIVAFHAAGGSAPLGVVVLAYMLGQLGNILPLPGGVGGVEPVMLGVLTASGVGSGLGAAAIVLYRFVALGTQGVLGAACVATLVPALREQPR